MSIIEISSSSFSWVREIDWGFGLRLGLGFGFGFGLG